MRPRHAVLASVALAAALLARPAHAQDDEAEPTWWVSAVGTMTRERVTFETTAQSLTGLLGGFEGGAALGRIVLRAGYLQGAISPTGPGDWRHDVVESFASLGVRVVRGLELSLGGQGRVYVTEPISERWVVWQLRARWEGPLMDTRARAWTEFWGSAGGDVNTVDVFRGLSPTPGYLIRGDGLPVDQAFKGARGGTVGVSYRFSPGAPVLKMGYTITESRLAIGGYRDTMEGLVFSIGFDNRRVGGR